MTGPFFLGIGGWHHDAAAALVRGGIVVAAAEEERFTRVKHQRGVPHRAIEFCLEKAGASLDEFGGVGVFFEPRDAVLAALRLAPRRLRRGGPLGTVYSGYDAYQGWRLYHEMQEALRQAPRLTFYGHHPSHAAAAIHLSGFGRGAVLSVDEVGESLSTWWGTADGLTLTQDGGVHYPHSLGKVYSAVSQFLGFEELEEFRVMGLAAWGTGSLVPAFERIIRFTPAGFEVDLDWFTFPQRPARDRMVSDRFTRSFGPPRREGDEILDRHRDLAFAVQHAIEGALTHLARIVKGRTGAPDLCLTGGVALNCVANGVIARAGIFSRVFVPFAAGDAGCAVGAALLAEAEAAGAAPSPGLQAPFLGPSFRDDEIEAALRSAGAAYDRPAAIDGVVARAVAEGKVVARFAGAMEFGPRALGHRSILADPRRSEIAERLNRAVKWREPFRPFAPSVPEESAAEWFDGDPSPYMAIALKVREAAAGRIPAVTHRDGTARVQAVRRSWDPDYHALHHRFAEITGVPVLLNTSFNVKGEPIVCSPADALGTYLATGLDAMAIGPFWLEKHGDGGG